MNNKRNSALLVALATSSIFGTSANAETKVTLNEFYRPFELSEITAKNMQTWPYYRYVSMNWDDYGLFGTVSVMTAEKPAKLTIADSTFDIQQQLSEHQTFVESLTATQTKGFMILKDNVVLGEFYDNGFSQDQTQLLQSSSKTYAGIIASQLIDQGKLDPKATVESYLSDFKDSKLGLATIQQVLDMQSGLLPASDYHVPGGEAFMFEAEQGLKKGETIGHRNAIINTKVQNAPGEIYNYNDKNTDLLALLAEGVTGQHFNKLLSKLFNDFGANSNGSIALTVDGSASPSYGISCTLRDYALFHQWIAQGKAPKSFYASIKDIDKDLLAKSEKGKGMAAILNTPITYASQGWYLPEKKLLLTIGSYGQIGFSDLKTGTAIVCMQDWEDNSVTEKFIANVHRAEFILKQLHKK
ncbi:serine hydrolase domain-containing protein [Rubritalea marina]|uniref:serine hydrolase domain-containing protein n=1 Tax=Rubritalea marina TaxID=361055 RepID=UPI000380318E|nr:serine hydrolase [Rubritalea marina]